VIVDFHSHTNKSDGTLAPQALADFMGERGVEIFSISDHDTLAAYGEFAPRNGARAVPAIEINTTWRENEVHVLGYNVPLTDSPIDELLAFNQGERRKRAERMVEQLRRGGVSITLEQVLLEAEDADSIGRPHVAKALVRSGVVPDVDSAFRLHLKPGTAGYVPQIYTTPEKAIDTIRASGGVAVLAHPGRLKDRSLIDALAPRGLQGLEVFYPLHDEDDVAFFRKKAAEYGLAMSAGMDFHDIRYHTKGVGMDVAPEDLKAFLELIGES
jgi:predicted metal-dependent phosphoesterase TrpH